MNKQNQNRRSGPGVSFSMLRMHFQILTIIGLLSFSGIIFAEPVDLISPVADDSRDSGRSTVISTVNTDTDRPGEFDPTLGAAAALNRALSLLFEGNAPGCQIDIEINMIGEAVGDEYLWAGFAGDILTELEKTMPDLFPEALELRPFDLAPSCLPVINDSDPRFIEVTYNDEEYLERLLQRLYFKLIQGPVLLTVPYCGNAESIPSEFREWNNFRYRNDDNLMEWHDVRLVYADWNLTQTVVLNYEDGKIACYDNGKKYYIDHTAAVAAAGAMFAHPDLEKYASGDSIHFVLGTREE